MIVDDIPIFLEYLREFIKWEEYGFEICAEASNGKEAYDKIEEYYPDVVLTDITMPYMDGLELAEKITKDYPEISIILITGNNEFEYAKRALKVGVCDYIVKPFEKEELIFSLLKLQDNINKAIENSKIHQDEVYRRKEKALQKAILGNGDIELLWKQDIKNAGINSISDYYLMGCIQLQISKEIDYENFLNWENVIISMLKNSLRVNGNYELFKDFQNNIIFIINFENQKEQLTYKAYELQDFPKIIEKSLGLECIICLGNYCGSLVELRNDYYEIQKTLKGCMDENVVKLFDGKETHIEMGELYIPLFLSELNEALINKEKELFAEIWDREWKNVFMHGNDAFKLQLFSTLLGLLLTDIINSGNSIESVYGEEFRPHKELYSIQEIEKKVDKLLFYYNWWIESASTKKISHSKIIAEKARIYIQAHYMKGDLNISDISRELFINQTYLRKMFKEEMGMTLLEFLTKYRMHVAKQLILENEHNLTQIAEMVGYNDVSYFSKCFKKYYQVSPKQMTKQHYQTFD